MSVENIGRLPKNIGSWQTNSLTTGVDFFYTQMYRRPIRGRDLSASDNLQGVAVQLKLTKLVLGQKLIVKQIQGVKSNFLGVVLVNKQ